MAVTAKFRVASFEFRVQTRNPKLETRNAGLFAHGQSAIEYAALIAVVVAALVGMSVYTKRALNGRWRAVGDSFGFGRQYERCVTLIDGVQEPGC